MIQLKAKNIIASLQDIATAPQEHLICFTLNSAHEVITRHQIFVGTLVSVPSHPREIFAPAIVDRAAAIIIAHNHPSGGVEPSNDDITTTQMLHNVGRIVGIPLIDHIIVGGNKEHFSFSQQGLLDSNVGELLEGMMK